MTNRLHHVAKKHFDAHLQALSERERQVIQQLGESGPVSRDTNRQFDSDLTFGQRLADRVASFGGSWAFIIIFAVIMAAWVLLNSILLARQGAAFDPYPYILLNLFLSMLASIQAPLILMAQNRLSTKDRIDATHDYEVNLKAELEILSLHDKLDELRALSGGSRFVFPGRNRDKPISNIFCYYHHFTSPRHPNSYYLQYTKLLL